MKDITFEIKFSYRAWEPFPCTAEINILLPAQKDGRLDEELLSPVTRIGGENLGLEWGYRSHEGFRSLMYTISDTEWDALLRRVQKTIDDMVGSLRQVVERNRRMMESVPQSQVVKFQI